MTHNNELLSALKSLKSVCSFFEECDSLAFATCIDACFCPCLTYGYIQSYNGNNPWLHTFCCILWLPTICGPCYCLGQAKTKFRVGNLFHI